MDKKKVVFQILDSYAEITITDQQDNIVFFEIGGKEYGCWYPEIDQDTGSPFIFVKNDTEYDYPHTSFSGPKPHIHWNGVSPPTSVPQCSPYV